MKRLVVFCDGTWNRADKPAVTNVCKLYDAVDRSEDAAVRQLPKYEEGVGSRRWPLLGGAFGVGLSGHVLACYRWLVDNYDPGDELFFFGFSRGAFTARSLAGLVRNSGILTRRHDGRIDEAYKLYRSRKPDDAPGEKDAELFASRYSHPPADIAFIGVWDTVGSLGIPIDGLIPRRISKLWSFHDTTLSKHVRKACHAISIDERRRPFSPTLWVKKVKNGVVQEPPEKQVVRQVWFAGVHSDVGGGYPDPALSELPLLWIAHEAAASGLVLVRDHLVVNRNEIEPRLRRTGIEIDPQPLGAKHDSLTRFYKLLRPVDRELKTSEGEPIGVSLASTARIRHDGDTTYRPRGLPEWLAQGRDVSDV